MKKYFAVCPKCADERELSRAVVASGRLQVCAACCIALHVYRTDTEPKPKRLAEGVRDG